MRHEDSATSRSASSAVLSKRIAVLGGGLSGQAACYHLLKLCQQNSTPVEIDLFEASSRLGGVFGTIEQGGYRLETGADMFITNKPAALKLAQDLGLADRLIETQARYRRSLILRRGRPVPTPLGFDLMVPRQLRPFLKSPLLSWPGKIRVLREYFLAGKPQEDETLASFAKRRFGREAFERIIQPMIGGIYTADPEKLSLRATLPRFLEMEAQHGSLLKAVRRQKKSLTDRSTPNDAAASGARYGLFLSFDRGMSVFQQALSRAIEKKVQIRYETPVEKITAQPDGSYQLEWNEGSECDYYDAVLLALPAPAAAKVLQETDSALAQELQAIEYASAAIVITGHRLSDIRDPMEAFGLVIPAIEKRSILAVSFTSRKFPDRAPEGSIQLRTFIGGALQQELLKKSDAELLASVRQELKQIFGVEGEPEISRVVRWNQAMPQYHLGHRDRVQRIRQLVASRPGFEVAGNALDGVGLPDVIQSSQAAVERLLAQWTAPQ